MEPNAHDPTIPARPRLPDATTPAAGAADQMSTVPRTRVLGSTLGRTVPGSGRHRSALGRLQLGDELGRGGMGVVQLAHDPELGRDLAIKFLNREDPDSAAQFFEEAQITAQLEHPNIVPVHDLGRDPSGRPWLSMKRIVGHSLADRLDAWRRERRGGPLQQEDYATILGIFGKVCDAVAFAHSRGVIHRDIKPHNVMVGEFGEVLLVDWGLARPLDGRDVTAPVHSARRVSDSQHTLAGEVFGTPAYMPPEQAQGQVAEIDERSDIFSLGGVLYHMLTLQPPYTGRTVGESLIAASRHRLEPPCRRAPAARIPRELDAIVMKAMAAEKSARYASVGDLQADLVAWQAHRSTRAWSAGPIESVLKWTRRNRAAVYTGAVAALALVVATVIFVLGLVEARDTARAEATRARDAEADSRQQAERARAAERDALVARGEAQTEAAAAAVARRQAEISLADGMVEQGNALIAAGQWFDGIHRLWSARHEATRLDHSTAGADWSLLDAERHVPRPLVSWGVHEGRVEAVVLMRDGRTAVSASDDGTLAVTDLLTGRVVHRPEAHTGRRVRLAALPDGTAAVSIDAGGTFRCVEVATGRDRFRVATGQQLLQVHVQPDSRTAVTADNGGFIRMWSLRDGSALPDKAWRVSNGAVTFAVSPDGRVLASGVGRTVQTIDLARGSRLAMHETTGIVYSVAFSPDGRQVLIGLMGGLVCSLDASTLAPRLRCEVHASEVGCLKVFPGSRIAIASGFYPVAFNLETGRIVRALHLAGYIFDIASDDRYRAVVGNGSGRLELFEVFPAQRERIEWPGHSREVTSMALSPDELLLATTSPDRMVRVFDTATGRIVWQARTEGAPWNVVFAPDGRLLAGCDDGTVLTYRLPDIEPVGRTRVGTPGRRMRMAVSGDGTRLALSAASSGHGSIHDLTDPALPSVADISGPEQALYMAVFSADSQELITGWSDGFVRVFDAATGEPLREWKPHSGHVIAHDLSPDGTQLATASGDTSVMLHDPAGGTVLGRVVGHSGWVIGVRYLGNSLIATMGADAQMLIADATNGRVLRILRPGGPPCSLVATGDGRRLYVGGDDGLIRVFDMARLKPRDWQPDSTRGLSEWLHQRGAAGEALEILQIAQRQNEQWPDRDVQLAQTRWLSGLSAEAVGAFAALRDAEPDEHRRLWLDLCARAANEQQHVDRAFDLWQRDLPRLTPGRHERVLDSTTPFEGSRYGTLWYLPVLAGQRITLTARSVDFIPALVLRTPDGLQRQAVQRTVDEHARSHTLECDRDGGIVVLCTTVRPGESGTVTLQVDVE